MVGLLGLSRFENDHGAGATHAHAKRMGLLHGWGCCTIP